jgi:hypothetical protein
MIEKPFTPEGETVPSWAAPSLGPGRSVAATKGLRKTNPLARPHTSDPGLRPASPAAGEGRFPSPGPWA